MRIYLDTCCLNRPFGDQTQDRIRLETEAIQIIFTLVKKNEWTWVGSDILNYEVNKIPDVGIIEDLLYLLNNVNEKISFSMEIFVLAKRFELIGIDYFDALHLAYACYGQVDLFFTVDDDFLKRASVIEYPYNIDIQNPLIWFLNFERGL